MLPDLCKVKKVPEHQSDWEDRLWSWRLIQQVDNRLLFSPRQFFQSIYHFYWRIIWRHDLEMLDDRQHIEIPIKMLLVRFELGTFGGKWPEVTGQHTFSASITRFWLVSSTRVWSYSEIETKNRIVFMDSWKHWNHLARWARWPPTSIKEKGTRLIGTRVSVISSVRLRAHSISSWIIKGRSTSTWKSKRSRHRFPLTQNFFEKSLADREKIKPAEQRKTD